MYSRHGMNEWRVVFSKANDDLVFDVDVWRETPAKRVGVAICGLTSMATKSLAPAMP